MNQEDYNFLEILSKKFRLDNNAKDVQQRTASIANNSNTSEQNDGLCANMISEVVKGAAERVNANKQQSRTASVTTSSVIVDEVRELQKFLSTYNNH